jgi:hypothetical protein
MFGIFSKMREKGIKNRRRDGRIVDRIYLWEEPL